MWALLHSIERILFPWLELGLAGLGGLGAGVTFDSTDLFGHRMLPQLRGLKWEPEQVLLWEGERESGRTLGVFIASLSHSSLLTSVIVRCTSAKMFEKTICISFSVIFAIPNASNRWTFLELLLLLAVISVSILIDHGNKCYTVHYETMLYVYMHPNNPLATGLIILHVNTWIQVKFQ